MHDFILSAVEREVDCEEYDAISRPATVSFSTDRSTIFCRWCRDIVELLTALDAATAFNTDLQDIRFLLNKGEIHVVQQEIGTFSICRQSLQACFEKRRTRLLDSHFELNVQNSISGTPE